MSNKCKNFSQQFANHGRFAIFKMVKFHHFKVVISILEIVIKGAEIYTFYTLSNKGTPS